MFMKTTRSRSLLIVIGAVLLPQAGCGHGEIQPHPYDKGPLAALESLRPIYKLDKDGRVVELKLHNKQLDDGALKQVSRLTALRSLSLFGSTFSDASLSDLRELGRLRALGLGKTPVTDKGLLHLRKVRWLRWLWINGNRKVSDSAVAELKKALPELEVHR